MPIHQPIEEEEEETGEQLFAVESIVDEQVMVLHLAAFQVQCQ